MPYKSSHELISPFYGKTVGKIYPIVFNKIHPYLISNAFLYQILLLHQNYFIMVLVNITSCTLYRLRLECSSLDAHLYPRNIVNRPDCTCGGTETTQHFLFDCPIYTNQRRLYLNTLPRNINSETLLLGNNNLSYLDNFTIFNAVH